MNNRNPVTVPNDRYYSMQQVVSQIPQKLPGKGLNNAHSMGGNVLQLHGHGVPYNVTQQDQQLQDH